MFFCAFQWEAFGVIRIEDAVFPEFVVSSRALGMGNAFIARTDNSAAAFYNPAGLGSVRSGHFHLSNFHLEANKGLAQASTGGSYSDIGSNMSKGYSLDGMRQLLLENRGQLMHERFQLMPNVIFRYFTAGYFYKKEVRSTLGEESTDLFEFIDRVDHGPYAAMNISLMGGVLKGGVTGIWLNRQEIIGERDPQTTLNISSSEYQKGRAFLMVYGAKLTLPIIFLPTFAWTLHNPTDRRFSNTGSTPEAPAAVKKNMVLGFSLTPQIFKFVRIHLEANYKDFTDEDPRITSARKITAGMEIDIARKFFLRAGYGDGFGSYGIGVSTPKLEVDISSYAVDTTSSKFMGKEDRRFALTISSGLGF